MGRGRLRVPAAVLAALLVAQAAVLVLAPDDGVLAPAPVDVRAYFSDAQVDRAEAFRGPQLGLSFVALGLELAFLALVVRRPPGWLVRGRGAIAGAALAVGLTLVALPVSLVMQRRAVGVGLSTQDVPSWLWDVARGTAISAVFAALGGLVAVWLLRRAPRRWWLAGAAAVWAYGASTIFLGPLVLDPVFNRFEPLRGPLRADVLRLADRAGVDVGEVLVMDASRRTTALNAYVAGLGATKRVVLYDTLVRDASPAEVRSVVAHELGHQRDEDLWGGLLFLALVAPAGLWAVATWQRAVVPAGGVAAVPVLALAVVVVSTGITWTSNRLSRDVEARADVTALELTRDPDALVALQRRFTVRNLSDPDPPWLARAVLSTHPSTAHRLGLALSWRAGPGAGSPAGP